MTRRIIGINFGILNSVLVVILFLYATTLLSVGINKDWRLIHEDDGARYTTIARSHVVLGFHETRFHDVFLNPHTNEKSAYGHHPPLISILLAIAFRIIGVDQPWVVRSLVILVHLSSLGLFLLLLRGRFAFPDVIVGGFIWSTLPMSAYFGQIYTQIVIGLLPVMIQMVAYDRYLRYRQTRWAIILCAGIILGGLIDWTPLFFSILIWGAELFDFLRRRKNWRLLAGVSVAGIFIFFFDVWHLYYAGNSDLDKLKIVFAKNADVASYKFNFFQFIGSWIEFYRRYFTHTGLFASIFIGYLFFRNKGAVFLNGIDPVLRRILGIFGLGATIHILAAPSYAKVHHYYYFYFLPFCALSILLIWMFIRAWAYRTPSLTRKVVMAIFWMEILCSSAYMFRMRHTRLGGYAIRETADIRAKFLLPKYLE